MKQNYFYIGCLLLVTFMAGCKKDGAYPGGTVSPYISILDLRDIYQGQEVTLEKDNMFGSEKITGIVVSDHSGGNMPAGLLVIQDRRRLNELRGISVNIGAAAADFVPGDSVVVDVQGGILKRADGILQVTGLSKANVSKISSGNTIPTNRVNSNAILANPGKYESTLIVLVKGGFNPLPAPTDVLAGDKVVNDGFGNMPIRTESTASFANKTIPFLANYFGIVFATMTQDKQVVPQFRIRTDSDIISLSSTPTRTPIIITGFISDVAGGDGNYEYMQFMATQDINFAATPYSVVVTNNAGASTPTGFPVNGWATGGMRTFKFNLTSGTAAKGTFFYVGGSAKLINGGAQTNPVAPASTDISSANWIRSFNYTTTDGDGFGNKTSGLLANSGNASGIAVFEGTTVNVNSVPVDVIFVATGGNLYTTTPTPQGYRITNTDWYDVKNPITLVDQPFYRAGTNTLSMAYTTSDLGYFYKLGGEFNVTLGRWVKARTQTNFLLTKQSTLADIQTGGVTQLVQ
jgi:hypothetical protein